MKRLALLIALFFSVQFSISAQCDFPFPPGNTIFDAPVYCTGLDDFCSTLPFQNTSEPFPGCLQSGIISNPQWLGFVAGSTSLQLGISIGQCYVTGEGIQAGLYAEESGNIIPIDVLCTANNSFAFLQAFNLVIGDTYYLLIDGFNSDVCDYALQVIEGNTVTPLIESIEPVELGGNLCAGETVTFSVPLVSNATNYDWTILTSTPLSFSLSGQGSNTLTVAIDENIGEVDIEVCVTANNFCDQGVQTCAAFFVGGTEEQVTLNETICAGDCFDLFGTLYCQTGTYTDEVIDACNVTVYTLNLVVIPSTTTFLEETLCDGECVNLAGSLYCEAGIYEVFFATSTNCDSLVVLDLTILEDPAPDLTLSSSSNNLDCIDNPTVQLQATSSIADLTYEWQGPAIDASNANVQNPTIDLPGTYTLVVTAAGGCSASASINIGGNNIIPEVTITGNTPLNCNTSVVTLFAESNVNIVLYEWIGPNGFTSNNATIITSDIGTYTVTVYTASGCSNTASVEVTENNADLTVDAGPDRHFQCLFVMTLDAPGVAGNDIQYTWTTDDGNILSGANTLNPVINQAGRYTLTAVQPSTGCVGSTTMIVYSSLTILAENTLYFECNTTSLTLDGSASYSGSDATVQWTTNNGNFVSGENTLTPVVDAPGTYQLIILLPGCVSFSTLNVIDNTAPPSLDLQTNNDTISCLNPVTLTAVTQEPVTYEWFYNGQSFLNSNSTFPAINAGIYEVVVSDANGCTNSAVRQIFGNADAPVVQIMEQGIITCNGGTGILRADIFPNDYDAIFWYTQDGEILGSNSSESIEVVGGGTYCVDVTSTNGCIGSACITVEPISTMTIDGNVTDVSCPGSSDGAISINVGQGCAPYSYFWNTGVGNSATLTNLVQGIYEVTVSDCNGCTATAFFEVGLSSTSAVVADAGADAYFDCLTDFFVLDGSASQLSPDAIVEWTSVDGVILAGQNTLVVTVGSEGTYTLTIFDPFGCTDTDDVIVFASTANAGADQEISCGQTTVTLDGSQSQSGSGVSYTWSTSDGNIVSGINSINAVVDAVGTYTLVVTSANTCTASDEVVVTGDYDTPDVSTSSASYALTSCLDPVTLSANSTTNGASLSWIDPNGQEVSGASYDAFAPGIYTAVATAPNGCTSTLEVEVTDNRIIPTINGDFTQYLNCFNGIPYRIELQIGTQGVATTNWTTSDGNITNSDGNTILVDAAGTYTVEVIDDANACTSTASFVMVENGVNIEVNTAEASCGAADGAAQVTTTGINNPTFLWSNGATTANVEGLLVGDYTVTVSASPGSCEEVLEVSIIQDISCFVNISGYVYNDDATLSCETTGLVSPLENVLVQLLPVGLMTTTTADGFYEFEVPPGDYIIEVVPESPFVSNCPESGTIAVSVPAGSLGSEQNNFFLDQLSNFELYITGGSGQANPGQNQNYQLTYCNNGFQTIFGAIVFRHDPILTFDAEAAGASTYDPETFTATWDFEDLSFFECEFLSFSLQVPADAPEGYILESEVVATPLLGDQNPGNNTISWQRAINFGNSNNSAPSLQQELFAVDLESEEATILLHQNQPNPFLEQTRIAFYLPITETAKIEIFDLEGRLVFTRSGFDKGYNELMVQRSDLKGAGMYFYRLSTSTASASGKMIMK